MSHSGPETSEDLQAVEQLGGIASQWVCHQHDVSKSGLHERLHDRFGCELHHHHRDETGVAKRTQCPVELFGDDGLAYAADFQAHYYPACMDGHSIYEWRREEVSHLFTSHSFALRDAKWHLDMPVGGLNPGATTKRRRDLMRKQLPRVAKLQPDYILPGYSDVGAEVPLYRLNARSRAVLKKTFDEIIAYY